MLQTPFVVIASVLFAAFLGAAGQHLFKLGAERAGEGKLAFLLVPWIHVAWICYISAMCLFIFAFRKGGTVTVLYPVYATTFIWAALIASFLYGQPVRPVHVAGMVMLIGGVYLMGIGNEAR